MKLKRGWARLSQGAISEHQLKTGNSSRRKKSAGKIILFTERWLSPAVKPLALSQLWRVFAKLSLATSSHHLPPSSTFRFGGNKSKMQTMQKVCRPLSILSSFLQVKYGMRAFLDPAQTRALGQVFDKAALGIGLDIDIALTLLPFNHPLLIRSFWFLPMWMPSWPAELGAAPGGVVASLSLM